jgi:hypothetical protein
MAAQLGAKVNINPIEVLAVAVNLAPELDSTNINVDPIEPGSKNASHAPAKTPRRETPAAAAVAFAS